MGHYRKVRKQIKNIIKVAKTINNTALDDIIKSLMFSLIQIKQYKKGEIFEYEILYLPWFIFDCREKIKMAASICNIRIKNEFI